MRKYCLNIWVLFLYDRRFFFPPVAAVWREEAGRFDKEVYRLNSSWARSLPIFRALTKEWTWHGWHGSRAGWCDLGSKREEYGCRRDMDPQRLLIMGLLFSKRMSISKFEWGGCFQLTRNGWNACQLQCVTLTSLLAIATCWFSIFQSLERDKISFFHPL